MSWFFEVMDVSMWWNGVGLVLDVICDNLWIMLWKEVVEELCL